MTSPPRDRMASHLLAARGHLLAAMQLAEATTGPATADDLFMLGIEVGRMIEDLSLNRYRPRPIQIDIMYPKGTDRRDGPTSGGTGRT